MRWVQLLLLLRMGALQHVEEEPIEVLFENLSDEPMQLWFEQGAPGDGARTLVAELRPGATQPLKSFAGHVIVWVRPPDVIVKRTAIFRSLDRSTWRGGGRDVAAPLATVDSSCADRHPDFCPGEAARGECHVNPGWMVTYCSASCGWCHLRDPKVRCSLEVLNMSSDDGAWGGGPPGALDEMFATMNQRVAARYPHVRVTTVRAPASHREACAANGDAAVGGNGDDAPWILTFDNFLSDEEIETLIASVSDWQRSTDTGAYNATTGETSKVVSDGRTSSSAWCRDATCEAQPAVGRVLARIEEFVRIPRSNFENFQVLKYGVGERYAAHHDFGASQRRLASGPRILTFFLYLSDVDEGGETAFPRIFEEDGVTPLAVRPRRGSALLWPSVRDGAMDQIDARTYHEARRVVRGTKFAANAWIHMRDFRTPHHWGCTGVFDEFK